MSQLDQPVYLSLSEASRLLGVHNTTLRRWADSGQITVYTTPGGHRRFALTDVEALSKRRSFSRDSIVDTWAQNAVHQARNEMQHDDDSPNWLQNLGEQERASWRTVGMQLMGVVLRYVSTSDPHAEEGLLEEARSIGYSYAAHALHNGVPLTTALEVALFFRDSMVDAAINLPEQATPDSAASARLMRRISRVLNVVKLAVVQGYEDQRRSHPTP